MRESDGVLARRHSELLRALTLIGEDGSIIVSSARKRIMDCLHSETELSFALDHNKPPHLRVYQFLVFYH